MIAFVALHFPVRETECHSMDSNADGRAVESWGVVSIRMNHSRPRLMNIGTRAVGARGAMNQNSPWIAREGDRSLAFALTDWASEVDIAVRPEAPYLVRLHEMHWAIPQCNLSIKTPQISGHRTISAGIFDNQPNRLGAFFWFRRSIWLSQKLVPVAKCIWGISLDHIQHDDLNPDMADLSVEFEHGQDSIL